MLMATKKEQQEQVDITIHYRPKLSDSRGKMDGFLHLSYLLLIEVYSSILSYKNPTNDASSPTWHRPKWMLHGTNK